MKVRKVDEGESQVECESCEIANCRYCRGKEGEIKDSSYKVCTMCETGYGMNNGNCIRCPDDC